MKVLITGVAGFIGSNLAAALLETGAEVVGIDDLSAGVRENIPAGVRFVQQDICRPEVASAFGGVEVVFHLAAKNCLADCMQHPVETARVNVTGTANILEVSRLAGVRKFIFAGSSAEYEGVPELPSTVDRVMPLSVYATTKRSGGLFCDSYRHLFGMNITGLRYFNVYGPVQDWRRTRPPVMSAFILKLLRGECPVIYGSGAKRRDFVYVDDVNAFHRLVMQDARTDNQTYNVGAGTSYSVNEIFALVEDQLATGLCPLYVDDLPGEAAGTLADISRERALGWQPTVDIREGIRRSIAYIREHVLDGVRE